MTRSTFRSVRFDFDAAVAVARIVENAGGTIAPELLAAGLGYSGTNNGTYLTRLANARTFGLVGGRGGGIELTGRGRSILAGTEPEASAARREAFLAVPLFRAVFETLAPGRVLAGRSELAVVLQEQFGESPGKAPVVAAKLLDSARQAGLCRVNRDGEVEVRRLDSRFTTVEESHPSGVGGRVVKFRRTRLGRRSLSAAGEWGGDVNDDQMWLDEGPQTTPKSDGAVSSWRRAGVVAAAVACLALVAVPVGVALTGSSAPRPTAAHGHHGRATVLGSGPAEHEVLGALSATTDSGSFDFAYTLKSTTPTAPVAPTTTTTDCHTLQVPAGTSFGGLLPGSASSSSSVSSSSSGSASSTARSAQGTATRKKSATTYVTTPAPAVVSHATVSNGQETITQCTAGPVSNPGTPVTGNGVSNINPKATLIGATVGTNGSGLQVTLRVNSTTLYEDLSTLETTLAPPPSAANEQGQPISGFAGLTESTIGMREGAVAMLGMASPTGYLDLYQQDISGATQTGTSTVNGVPVTVYQVAVDPTQLVNEPNITAEESKTASDAVSVLHAQGYTGTTDEVSIDGSGFIREVDSVAHFSDGGTVVLDVTLSDFGCAGTVLMPGQQGADQPPSGCTSPDTGQAATAQSSSTTSTEPPTTTPPVPTTTPPVPTVPATTTPGSSSTTSTPANGTTPVTSTTS